MQITDSVLQALDNQNALFKGIVVSCCMGRSNNDCICGDSSAERALRAYNGGASLPAMNDVQRNYCLDEIAAVEGYERSDYANCSDRELAHGVLCAWTDSARDRGMY